MVGRETFLIAVAGLPAMKFLGSVSVSAVSGPLAGRASGTLPGQMGIWVWPREGGQTGCWAGCWERRAGQADRMQRVRSRGFIGVPGTRIFCDRQIEGSKAEGHPTGRRFVEERKCGTGAAKGTGVRARRFSGWRTCGDGRRGLRLAGRAARRAGVGDGAVALAGGGLGGTAAGGSVGAGGGALGERAGFAALRAEAGSHPFAGTERAFEQRGDPEIGVEE